MDLTKLLFHNQLVLFAVMSAFIIGGVIKKEGYFKNLYFMIATKWKGINNRFLLTILSMIGGILPLEGRCIVSAPLLDSLVKPQKDCLCGKKCNSDRGKLGVIDYVSTHHYYLWSPLEPAVMIIIAALGISYASFMSYMVLPLLAYFAFFVGLLFFYIKDDDISFIVNDIGVNKQSNIKALVAFGTLLLGIVMLVASGVMVDDAEDAFLQVYMVFPAIAVLLMVMSKTTVKEAFGMIKFNMVLFVALVVIVGNIAKTLYPEIKLFLDTIKGNILLVTVLGAFASFTLGSSSKYSGIAAMILKVTSTKFLPIVLISEYIGYLLSPTHKCLGISSMYFGTSISETYKILTGLAVVVMSAGYISYMLH